MCSIYIYIYIYVCVYFTMVLIFYDSITSDIDNMIDELLSEDDKDSSDNHNIKLSRQQLSSVDNK